MNRCCELKHTKQTEHKGKWLEPVELELIVVHHSRSSGGSSVSDSGTGGGGSCGSKRGTGRGDCGTPSGGGDNRKVAQHFEWVRCLCIRGDRKSVV